MLVTLKVLLIKQDPAREGEELEDTSREVSLPCPARGLPRPSEMQQMTVR